ncbi:MAG: CoA-binding protein [Armatimonadetes bacterium]|nr:CoA-binding protein [Armatimonadota bacterium]
MSTSSIAVIGANKDPGRYSNKAVRAWKARGYEVYPVNPNEDGEVEGLMIYDSILDVPEPVEEATLYVRPSIGIGVLEDLKAMGIQKVYVNPGAESMELLEKAYELGLKTIVACSILAAGSNPNEL